MSQGTIEAVVLKLLQDRSEIKVQANDVGRYGWYWIDVKGSFYQSFSKFTVTPFAQMVIQAFTSTRKRNVDAQSNASSSI